MKRIILVDFSWLYNKYYYVAKYAASQQDGFDANKSISEVTTRMLRQFLNVVINSYRGASIMLALDSPTSSLKNMVIFKDYKQNRNKEEKREVYKNLNEIIKELNKLSLTFIKAKSYEADQLIARIVKKYHKNGEIIIFSGDKDLIQLTSYPNVYISDKFEKGNFLIKTDKELFEKFKNSKGEDFTRVSTNKRDILKYRTLKGDTSDNLSPVFPRIKDTEIIDIVKNYWIDEEELSEVRINDIIDDIRGDNQKLAEKLEANKQVWLRNYKIMDLLHVEDFEIKKLG